MAKKTADINPERGIRLKELINRLGITQVEFASSVNYSDTLISQIISGNRKLTEDAVERIVQKYPQFLKEWLMGFGDRDCATQEEKDMAEVKSFIDNLTNRERWFKDSANLVGTVFNVSVKDENGFCPDFEYTLTKDGSSVTLGSDELMALENELLRFVDFRIGELFRERGN